MSLSTRQLFPKSTAIRYGSISVMALVNTIMLAGTARAADATNGSSTPTSNTSPSKPATSAKPATSSATTAKPAPGTTAKATSGSAEVPTVLVTKQLTGSYTASGDSSPLYTEPLVDTPQTITVIPKAVMQDQNATTLRDILRNVPGISFQAGEGSSTVAGDNLSIRGFNARDDMFIDGIRDTGIYTRDAFNTEAVEVVKGPASAYEGYGQTGGSVNLVSKAPTLTPSYEIDGGYGTNQYNRESLDINQPVTDFGNAGVAVRLNAFQQYNEVADRDFTYDGRWGFAPSISVGLGTPTRVTLSYLHQREDDLPDYGFPFVNAAAIKVGSFSQSQLNQLAPLPQSNWYGLVNRDHETAITDIPTLKIEHDFDDGITLENQTRYDRTSFDAFNTSARFDTPPTAPVPLKYDSITRELSARTDVDALADNKTFVTIPFQTWGVGHTLVTSLELSHESDEFSTGLAPFVDTSLSDPNAFAPYTGTTKFTDKTTNLLEDVAVSAFDTIKFTPQWEITGGARFDHLDSSSNDPGPLTLAHFAREDDLFSGRAAVVYKPLPFGSIYAGFGNSFNPSIQGVSDGASNDVLAANTANLPPEQDIAYEFGSKWDLLDQKLSLNLALFRTVKTNARIVDPTEPGTVYLLSGDQRVQGVEFDAAGNLTQDWKIFGGYVYQTSRVLSGPPSSFPGNSLPNTPSQSVSLWTTYELPWHFTIGTGVNFVDQRYSLVNELNSAPGYWTQQAMIAYKVNKNIDVQANIYNIWDESYVDLVGAHQDVLGAGRTIIVSTRIKF